MRYEYSNVNIMLQTLFKLQTTKHEENRETKKIVKWCLTAD